MNISNYLIINLLDKMDGIYKECYIFFAKTGYTNRQYFVECKKKKAYIYCIEQAKKGIINFEDCLKINNFYDK